MSIEPLTPERRRRQTREYLLEAAAAVFTERGYHGASLDDVAAVAGFTKGAVYSNFESKDDLFLALLDSRRAQEMKGLRGTLETSEGPWDAHLSDFVALFRSELEAGDDWVVLDQEFWLHAIRNAPARKRLAELDELDITAIAEIIETDRRGLGIPTNEPAEHAARIVVALSRGISQMRAVDAEKIDEPFLESVISFVGRALTAEGDVRSGPVSAVPHTKPAPKRRS